MGRLLIKSGIIVAMDRSVPDLERGDILIEDQRIAAVAPTIGTDGAEIIDTQHAIVMPDLIDAFLHGSPKPDPRPGQPHFSEIPHPRGELERLARGRLAARDARVTLGMAILGPAYSTYEVSRQDLRLARELGLIASMHVGGGQMLTPDGFARLLGENLIDARVNIVHGNSIPFEELRALVERGAGVTVTPDIELQM